MKTRNSKIMEANKKIMIRDNFKSRERKTLRCSKCNKKLAITTGILEKIEIELKCPRCKKIEIIKGGHNG